MYRFTSLAAVIAASLVVASSAMANPANSFQPAHVYFGDVPSGSHPNKLVTLHNGTGAAYTLETIAISGSGGRKFTLVGRSALLSSSKYPRCRAGLTLAPGARCVFDVRVKTTQAGWWRSVLSVVPSNGQFNSAELRAHVS